MSKINTQRRISKALDKLKTKREHLTQIETEIHTLNHLVEKYNIISGKVYAAKDNQQDLLFFGKIYYSAEGYKGERAFIDVYRLKRNELYSDSSNRNDLLARQKLTIDDAEQFIKTKVTKYSELTDALYCEV